MSESLAGEHLLPFSIEDAYSHARNWGLGEMELTGEESAEMIHRRFFEKIEEHSFFPPSALITAHSVLTTATKASFDVRKLPARYQLALRKPTRLLVNRFIRVVLELSPDDRKKAAGRLWEITSFVPEQRQRLQDLMPILDLDIQAARKDASKFRPWLSALEKLAVTPRLQRPAIRQQLLAELKIPTSEGIRLVKEFEKAYPLWKKVDPTFLLRIAGTTDEYVIPRPPVPGKNISKPSAMSLWQIAGLICFGLVVVLRIADIGNKAQNVITPSIRSSPPSSYAPSSYPSGPTAGTKLVEFQYRLKKRSNQSGWGPWQRRATLVGQTTQPYEILTTADECVSEQLGTLWPFVADGDSYNCKITRMVKERNDPGGTSRMDVLLEFEGGEIFYHLTP